jgi:type IV secretory pathway VirB10-like protein
LKMVKDGEYKIVQKIDFVADENMKKKRCTCIDDEKYDKCTTGECGCADARELCGSDCNCNCADSDSVATDRVVRHRVAMDIDPEEITRKRMTANEYDMKKMFKEIEDLRECQEKLQFNQREIGLLLTLAETTIKKHEKTIKTQQTENKQLYQMLTKADEKTEKLEKKVEAIVVSRVMEGGGAAAPPPPPPPPAAAAAAGQPAPAPARKESHRERKRNRSIVIMKVHDSAMRSNEGRWRVVRGWCDIVCGGKALDGTAGDVIEDMRVAGRVLIVTFNDTDEARRVRGLVLRTRTPPGGWIIREEMGKRERDEMNEKRRQRRAAAPAPPAPAPAPAAPAPAPAPAAERKEAKERRQRRDQHQQEPNRGGFGRGMRGAGRGGRGGSSGVGRGKMYYNHGPQAMQPRQARQGQGQW